jgi:hypothetical protein
MVGCPGIVDKQQPASLYECSYNLKCKHVWVASSYGNVTCPKCSAQSVNIIANYIHPDLKFVRLQAVTFASHRTISFKAYQKDYLLRELASNGFAVGANDDYGYETVTLTNILHEVAIFKFSKSRKTTDVYVGLHVNDEPLFGVLAECVRNDKKNKKAEPPKPKPIFETISDAVGQEIRVGDWVTCWSTNSLGFGKVETIGEFTNYQRKYLGARIRTKNKILLPFKTSKQLFKLPNERAMLLMLEG